jgi:hypothetical protein
VLIRLTRLSVTPIDTGRLSSSILVKKSLPSLATGEVEVRQVVGIMRDLMDQATEFDVMLYFVSSSTMR